MAIVSSGPSWETRGEVPRTLDPEFQGRSCATPCHRRSRSYYPPRHTHARGQSTQRRPPAEGAGQCPRSVGASCSRSVRGAETGGVLRLRHDPSLRHRPSPRSTRRAARCMAARVSPSGCSPSCVVGPLRGSSSRASKYSTRSSSWSWRLPSHRQALAWDLGDPRT